MARSFNGSTQYGSGGTNITGPPFSMSAWFKSSALSSGGAVCSIGASGANSYHRLEYDASAVYATSQTAGTQAFATSTGAPSSGAWQHIGGVWASSTSRAVYLNGGSKGTSTTSNSPSGIDTASIGVCIRSITANYANAVIGEVAFWNVALSDAEMAALAKGVSPLRIRPNSLVEYWPFYGLASPEPPLIAAGHTLSLTLAPTAAAGPPVQPFSSRWWGAYPFTASGSTTSVTFSASCAGSGSLVRQARRTLAATGIGSAALTRQVGRSLAGTGTGTGALVRQVQRACSAAASGTGSLLRRVNRTCAGAASGAGILGRSINRALAASAAGAGSLSRQVGRTLATSCAGAADLTTARFREVVLAAACSPAASVFRNVSRSLGGAAAGTGSLARSVGRGFTGTAAGAGALLRVVGRTLRATAAGSGLVGWVVHVVTSLIPVRARARGDGAGAAGAGDPFKTRGRSDGAGPQGGGAA